MDNPGEAKYGMTYEQMREAYLKLQTLGAKYFGIHAFLASNTQTEEYYPALARILFEVAVRLRDETGADIRFINLSGGVGIPYEQGGELPDILRIGAGVEKAFHEVLVPVGMGGVAIFTELGRFMLGPYGCLVTRAMHEKHTYKEYIGVDACAANLMRPAMYGSYHHITVMGKEDAPADHKYDVTGGLDVYKRQGAGSGGRGKVCKKCGSGFLCDYRVFGCPGFIYAVGCFRTGGHRRFA